MKEEIIQKLLESKSPNDQKLAIEYIYKHRSWELSFIPVNGMGEQDYLLNKTGLEGFIHMDDYIFLIGCNSFRKISPDTDLLVDYEVFNP